MTPGELGEVVYDIEANGKSWSGIGAPVETEPRVGFTPPGSPREWHRVRIHVTEGAEQIPEHGLSVFSCSPERSRIGGESAWRRTRLIPAGKVSIVELTTRLG